MKEYTMLSSYANMESLKVDWVECGQLLGISSDRVDDILERIDISLNRYILKYSKVDKVNGGVEFYVCDAPHLIVRLSELDQKGYTRIQIYSSPNKGDTMNYPGGMK